MWLLAVRKHRASPTKIGSEGRLQGPLEIARVTAP